ncbi:putative S-adenosyl-L-methionine-dependent methyltransferase protein [Corchorus capsularis]|uniref:Putative S-adenosyl-L-methionine-dependent methyltransferase protein n=1 Tax=Corchorus capsularis TaxID=210143 RepID=A0A1R3GG03_COCAP|nr:putative S-adenosyl-L-methionine-dependent methyltransferase protein [Corchorus capsularis]
MGFGGKSRSNKRSSSSVSYTSTITTVVFVTLCVFGVWMLTSNSVEPPQTTTRTATGDNNADNNAFSGNEEQHTRHSNNDDKDNKAVFEDNPGQLPDDAVKPDDDKGSESESKGKDVAAAVEENPGGLQGKESSEEQMKQKLSETQISEESVMTQNQHQQTSMKEFDVDKHTKIEETSSNQDSSEEDQSQNAEQQNQDSEDQQLSEDSKQKEDVGSQEETSEENKKEDDDQGKAKNESTESEDHEQIKGNKQQSQEKEMQMQEIANTTFGDETKDKQKEILKEPHQTDAFQTLLKPSTDTATTDQKNTQSETQNQEITQQQVISSDSSNLGESLGNSIPKESSESKKSWKTQKTQSESEKERRKDDSKGKESIYGYTWQLCNVTAGPDYIPCLDNEKALRQLHSTKHFEHRERHCPEDPPTCLVPLPEGYKRPILWPQSRDKIWYHNVPHTKLAQVKGHQNWVKVSGEFLTFPGGGTQFIHGALHYIDFLQQSVPDIKWGKHTRVILDVGCGVASFGGFLFERDVLTMSFAPKDEHEAQVHFALERGIPAISAVMGSQRLPFPSRVFDIVHCARCRVPWHAEGGLLLLELNRVLRPGGFFVWSATPVYQKLPEDVEIWKAMSSLTASMCWELVTIKRDTLNSVGAAIYRKPTSNECYDNRQGNSPPMCKSNDDPNAAWHVPLQACMHHVPVNQAERGARWPAAWPARLQDPPYWLNRSQMGIYGKPAPQDFARDYEHWTRVVGKLYMSGLGISWSNVRNVMDMRAVYGGFAAALRDIKVWVLNVVNFDSPDTLPIIYERGLFGIYHDWCESFSTYPRSYDLLHADHLFSKLKARCKLEPVMAEVDRIVRPGGKLIVRDESNVIGEVENLLKSLHWEVHLTFSKDDEGILSAQKGDWRPTAYQAVS